jgi:glycosyltransferase involved in cell wall biosynthesis
MRPDVLDGNWLTRQGGLYCSFSGYHPFLATAWASDSLIEAKKSRILRLFGKLTVRIADSVIVEGSEVTRKAVIRLGCDSSKIYSFPWGIDLDTFRPRKKASPSEDLKKWGRKTKIIISTRNHSPIYGIEYLIRAIPLILEKVDYARFLIAGDGPLLTYHRALVRQLGIEECVRFLGRIPNAALAELLNYADIYVSTSFSDGASISLLEALATGLPTVVTAIPANREWIVPGRNGFLVPPGDSSALADSVVRLLESKTLRSKMRHFNRRVAEERADWKTNSTVLERCISNLLEMSERSG